MAYHFVDLSEAEKADRRRLLDLYATFAQASVLIPLWAVQCAFLLTWASRRWGAQRPESAGPETTPETPSSPYQKDAAARGRGGGGERRRRRASWRRAMWWAGGDVEVLGMDWGTRGEVLGALGWTVWLVTLCFLDTGDDYLHLTKRFGIVAASQLPLHYLLALKMAYSPLQYLTRCSHETLNRLHQLLGRIVTSLLYLHAGLYLNFYVQSGLLAAKLQQFYVLCGIFAIVSLSVVGTTALAPVRRWSYRVFYITHVTLAAALLPVLFFHVSHVRVYVYETAALYVLGVVVDRTRNSRTMTGTATPVRGTTTLVDIDVPVPRTAKKTSSAAWSPGQHAYLSLPGHPMSQTFWTNPFTVASLPHVDGRLRFVARVLDGNTARLARVAKPDSDLQFTVEGPYGVTSHADRLLRAERVLFVAGGIGATFIVPLYRQLLADLSPGPGSRRRGKVSFLWIARSLADVTWALPEEARERAGFVERLKVCVTRADADVSSTSHGSFVIGGEEGEEEDGGGWGEGVYAPTEEGIELEERKNLLSSATVDGSVTKGSTTVANAAGLATYAGRPDLGRVADQLFSRGGAERVAVVVCGPRSLGRSLRKEVGRWVADGREVWFWDERFAL